MERKIDSLLNRIEGYAGYRDKENRRDDDRRLRESISASLDSTVSKLTSVSAKLAEDRNLKSISTIERLVGATRLISDRVRTATYGYGGIFTENSIDEFALDQLRQFDASFQKEASSLASLADRLAGSETGPLDVDITAYQDEINRLGALFDARSTVVESARPSKDATVLAMLEPPKDEKPSTLAALRVGDALSVLGDNFIVDATVTLSEPDSSVTLARIGNDSDGKAQWIIGGTTSDIPDARLTETDGAAEATESGRTAKAIVSTGTEAKEGVSAQYGYTAATGNTVTFWYSIGGETRTFSGTTIEDGDIEVYGQA